MRGALITVEGVEGSGKSTQCARLAQYLTSRGTEVVQTSEPDEAEHRRLPEPAQHKLQNLSQACDRTHSGCLRACRSGGSFR